VPFFWTSQHKLITEYVGYAQGWDEIVFDGEPAKQEFVACYVKDGRVRAAAGCGRSLAMDAVAEILKRPEPPTPDDFREELQRLTGS
jgi:hypothetical protein